MGAFYFMNYEIAVINKLLWSNKKAHISLEFDKVAAKYCTLKTYRIQKSLFYLKQLTRK